MEAERQGLLSITERLLCARHRGGVSHGFPSGRHSHGLHLTAKKPAQGLSSWPKCAVLWLSEGAFLQTQRGLEAEGRAVRVLVRGGLGVWSLEAGSCRRAAQHRLKGQDNHRVDLAFPWVSLPEGLPGHAPWEPALLGPLVQGSLVVPSHLLASHHPLQQSMGQISQRPANAAGLGLGSRFCLELLPGHGSSRLCRTLEQLTTAEELESSLGGERNSLRVLFRGDPGERATWGTYTPPWPPVFCGNWLPEGRGAEAHLRSAL